MQESLEDTQAEANALVEEAAASFLNERHDEGHDDRAWGCVVLHVAQDTLKEVAAALGRSYNAWFSTRVGFL